MLAERQGAAEAAKKLLGALKLEPVRDWIDSLVHPSARHDVVAHVSHRSFIATRLFGGLAALTCMPIWLALHGAPETLDMLALGWMLAPIAIAVFLSRTGFWQAAHLFSALALVGLTGSVAAMTGGGRSFVLVWLAVVPLEAAMSGSRRVVISGLAAAVAMALALAAGSWFEWFPASRVAEFDPMLLHAIGVGSAVIYATGSALGMETFARRSTQMRALGEARYRLLTDNITDVITRHGRNGSVQFVSPAGEQLFGLPLRGLYGHGMFDRVHVADRPAYLTALSDAAERAETVSVEFRIRRDGSAVDGSAVVEWVWVEMRCRPIEAIEGEALAAGRQVVAITRDISKARQHQDELEIARAESEKSNMAKSRFLATMSHELRTPLNAIIGFSEMLLNEQMLNLDEVRRAEYAKLIHESGHHLLAVVNGILDMSKIEAGHFELTTESFPMPPVIKHCLELVRIKAQERDIALRADLPADLPEIIADKRAFKQILLNVLSNAVKFSNASGTIVASATRLGSTIRLSVEDNGIGIAAEDVARLGMPFFQAQSTYDRNHEGTGLGLSVVKGLTELHGGRVEISSRIGVGTRVDVYLPVDCEARAAKPQAGVVAKLNGEGATRPNEEAATGTKNWVRKSA